MRPEIRADAALQYNGSVCCGLMPARDAIIDQRPGIDFVVLNWNDPQSTAALVADLCSYREEGSRIVVVDNGSSHDKRRELEARLRPLGADIVQDGEPRDETPRGGLIVVLVKENCGCTGGYNVGLRFAAKGGENEYVWLFNNDVRVPDRRCVTQSVEFLATRSAPIICSPPVASNDGWIRLECKVGLFGMTRTRFIRVGEYQTEPGQSWESDHLIGCSLIISKSAVARIGYLDEDFFLYGEELDWCYRGMRAGIEVCVLAVPPVVHGKPFRRETNTMQVYYKARNSVLVVRKYHGQGLRSIPWYLVRLGYLAVVVGRAKRGPQAHLSDYLKAACRGLRDGFHGLAGRAM